ncbi:MAG: helix-turn-helix domain-containing protein [Sphingomonadales bacterium]|nr:helix-turn-helix domain-containing protein [Sphingomonadales bacterium]MDE2171907.1 helix-turn-helix domain-containing protein [Sphingomonadales bacterium]
MSDDDIKQNDPLLMAVGKRIQDLREAKHIEQKDFAKAAGFSLSYLWRLEGGQQNINLRTISRVALALGEPMSALLSGIEADPATLEKRPYNRKD